MPRFDFRNVLICQCGDFMFPNMSTEDSEGLAWICVRFGCGDYTANELEAEDLEALGVPNWIARQLVALLEALEQP